MDHLSELEFSAKIAATKNPKLAKMYKAIKSAVAALDKATDDIGRTL